MKNETRNLDVRKISADALRQAAKIAESEQSPLAFEFWHDAAGIQKQSVMGSVAVVEQVGGVRGDTVEQEARGTAAAARIPVSASILLRLKSN